METYFASPERSPKDLIFKMVEEINHVEYINEIFKALPNVGAVLDKNRQIIFGNEALIKLMGADSVESFLGLRPGEALQCKNSKTMPGGCGTSEACRHCGAVNAIVGSQQLNKTISEECRINSIIEGEKISFDLKLTATPFEIKGNSYTIIIITDISSEKRKLMLEKVFFHDILNLAGSLKGFSDLLKNMNDFEKMKELSLILNSISNELIEEINMQRDLVMAENKTYSLRLVDIVNTDIILNIASQMQKHNVAENRFVNTNINIERFILTTDVVLLKRVLINLVKNALEACPPNETVTINSYIENENAVFEVHNNYFIPHDIQLQLFQRSFSTKGANRGLGTYSIRLFTEDYLKGKVSFQTSEKEGTTFFIKLPIVIEKK
jgi:K+-sensing histidine kinase KdpD